MRDDEGLAPILLVALAVFLMSAMDATMKALTQTLPVAQATFLRYAVAAAVLLPIFVLRRERLLRGNLPAHLLRGALVAATALSFFFAIARLPLALVVAVAFTSPLFVALLGRVILGEPIGRRTAIAILVGFAGVLVILGGEIEPGAATGDLLAFAAALGGALGYALVAILIRRQSASDTTIAIVTLQTVAAGLFVATPGALAWRPPDGAEWALAIALGLMGTAGQLCLAAGLARGRAARLALIEYTAFPWAAVFGLVLFAEMPRPETIAGAVVIVAACLWGLRLGRALPRGRATARVPLVGPTAPRRVDTAGDGA